MVDYDKIPKPKSESSKAIFNFGAIVLVICISVGLYCLFNNSFVIGISLFCGGIVQFVFWASLSEIISLLYDIKMKL